MSHSCLLPAPTPLGREAFARSGVPRDFTQQAEPLHEEDTGHTCCDEATLSRPKSLRHRRLVAARCFRPGNRTGKPTQLNSNQAGLGVWSLYSTVTLHDSQNSKQNRRGPQDSPGPGAASVPCSNRAVMSFPTEGQQARHTLHRLTMRRKHGKQITAKTIHCNSLRPPASTPAHHAGDHLPQSSNDYFHTARHTSCSQVQVHTTLL